MTGFLMVSSSVVLYGVVITLGAISYLISSVVGTIF